eukprot:GFUD01056096.1.p1 GENE.GFUD01056096.1~~GFUD01056096.1.p1  ORF type:complete len:124 (+),score=4.90 GFUD01056096.1:30-374(+)
MATAAGAPFTDAPAAATATVADSTAAGAAVKGCPRSYERCPAAVATARSRYVCCFDSEFKICIQFLPSLVTPSKVFMEHVDVNFHKFGCYKMTLERTISYFLRHPVDLANLRKK